MSVTEKDTDVADRASIRKKSCGHRMPEHVWVDSFGQSRLLAVAIEASPGAMGPEPLRCRSGRDEQCREVVLACCRVARDPVDRRFAEIHVPLLPPFPDDAR